MAGADAAQRQRRRQEVAELERRVAPVVMDVHETFDKGVRVRRLEEAAGEDAVEAPADAGSEQILPQVPAGSGVRERSVRVAGNDRRNERGEGDGPVEGLISDGDSVILEGSVVVAVVDRDRVRKEVLTSRSVILRVDEWKPERDGEPVGHAIGQPDTEALRADVTVVRLDTVTRVVARSQVVPVDEHVAVTEREGRFSLRRQPGLRARRRSSTRDEDPGEQHEEGALDPSVLHRDVLIEAAGSWARHPFAGP